MTLAEAIARYEGYYRPDTLAARNNNPGNLRAAPSRYCQTGSASGYVHFCTPADGWAALENQIAANAKRGLTLEEFFRGKPGVYAGYAPAADRNDPGRYARTVAEWLGLSPASRVTAPASSGVPGQLQASGFEISTEPAWSFRPGQGNGPELAAAAAIAAGLVLLFW